ncbi:MAG: prolyl oligopeptidase family serine peptidase [Puia sp.]
MKKHILLILGFMGHSLLFAQGKNLDNEAAVNWPVIEQAVISNDGKFVAYVVKSAGSGSTLVVQAVNSSWKKEMKEVAGKIGDIQFTENSRWFLFREESDSIGIFDIAKDTLYYLGSISDFAISKESKGQWIAYKTGKEKKDLSLLDLYTLEEKRYFNIYSYLFADRGHVLVMNARDQDGMHTNSVIWHDLSNGKDTIISNRGEASNFAFDNSGTQLAFLSVNKIAKHSTRTLLYYKSGLDTAIVLVNSRTEGVEKLSIEEREINFSAHGDKLFFYIKKEDQDDFDNASNDKAQVRVLNYHDDTLQFAQMHGSLLSVIDLETKKNVRILGKPKDFSWIVSKGNDGNYVIVESNVVGSPGDYKWHESASPDIYLVSVKDGTRTLLKSRLISYDLYFSPEGKYIVWYDRKQRNWFSYNIEHHFLRNITQNINAKIYLDNNEVPDYPDPAGIAGWKVDDESVLIYDRFDIWQVDPDDVKPPVNLTGGYGRKNNTCLRYLTSEKEGLTSFFSTDTLLLTAFNLNTKDNGFIKLPLSDPKKVTPLFMQSRMYYFPGVEVSYSEARLPFLPMKAKNANVYIVKRMSATEYPNIYTTNDFKTFRPITALMPQKNFNWYKAELIHWKMLNGMPAEGILYKPENFDPNKKYPVIFHYYEKNSNALNFFIQPELSNGVMNIPWFVSNGYIVIVPNIYYKIGDPGAGVYSTIISLSNYVSRIPWIDINHMGLQGHSFGGWETNYMVSRTSIFTAAAPAAGPSNFVCGYGEKLPSAFFYERGQGRMGATLWQSPNLYAKNSPHF